MTDRPIIFSAPMVRALLDGRKTQTRRIVKPQPEPFEGAEVGLLHVEGEPLPRVTIGRVITRQAVRFAVGDRLWVRENIWQAARYPGTLPSGEPEPLAWCWGGLVRHAADGDPPDTPNRHYPEGLRNGAIAAPDPYASWLKRPSIHMPRRASRLTLTVTGVRLQRLQEIGETDALAEGMTFPEGMRYGSDPVEAFRGLWEALHGAAAWASNPYVVALTFTVARRNIDAAELANR